MSGFRSPVSLPLPPAWVLQAERVGAFLPGPRMEIAGAAEGPLSGLVFAVKDVLDVAGVVTGNGHPDWARTHEPARAHAAALARALAAGATMVGKTISDELAYSLTGENVHYGTPLNSAAPQRVPGGSSSGSAAAVAAGLVDFALGSDCGGSVRVPSSYCGIMGMRPTHGAVPAAGIAPFAPSFDCVGWFARDPQVFAAVGAVLLGAEAPAPRPSRLLLATDAFAMVDDAVRAALAPAVARVEAAVAPAESVVLAPEGLAGWSAAFRALQAAEIWQSVGGWIEAVRPQFGPGVAERFAAAAVLNPAEVEAARPVREAVIGRTSALLAEGTVLVLPTTPRCAPQKGSAAADTEVTYRHLAMKLLCTAGLAGLPQVSLPLAEVDGAPIGLSLVGRRGSDMELVELAAAICAG